MKSREEYEEYAEANGYVLGKHADRIIMMVEQNYGSCPCKRNTDDNQSCPCPDHHSEIEKNGHCTCSLFFKGE